MSDNKSKPQPNKPTINQTPGQYSESSVKIDISSRKPASSPKSNTSKKSK